MPVEDKYSYNSGFGNEFATEDPRYDFLQLNRVEPVLWKIMLQTILELTNKKALW